MFKTSEGLILLNKIYLLLIFNRFQAFHTLIKFYKLGVETFSLSSRRIKNINFALLQVKFIEFKFYEILEILDNKMFCVHFIFKKIYFYGMSQFSIDVF